MSVLVPNLQSLRIKVSGGADAESVVATFDTDSLEQARSNLRSLVSGWDASPADEIAQNEVPQ